MAILDRSLLEYNYICLLTVCTYNKRRHAKYRYIPYLNRGIRRLWVLYSPVWRRYSKTFLWSANVQVGAAI